ncbi:uncharacterized [Tachysurus ichikawai]
MEFVNMKETLLLACPLSPLNSLPNPDPRLSSECLALARGNSGESCGIMKLPLRKQIRSNSQGEEHWNQIALITYQVLQRIHKDIGVMKDEPETRLAV